MTHVRKRPDWQRLITNKDDDPPWIKEAFHRAGTDDLLVPIAAARLRGHTVEYTPEQQEMAETLEEWVDESSVAQ